jgi:hypothetical protein
MALKGGKSSILRLGDMPDCVIENEERIHGQGMKRNPRIVNFYLSNNSVTCYSRVAGLQKDKS